MANPHPRLLGSIQPRVRIPSLAQVESQMDDRGSEHSSTSSLIDFSYRITDFGAHFPAMEEQHNRIITMMRNMLKYGKRLEATVASLSREMKRRDGLVEPLQDAEHAEMELQKRLQESEAKIKQYHDVKNQNPYVLILIDGDGVVFDNAFIKEGYEGGKRAAHALAAAVTDVHNQSVAHAVANVYDQNTGHVEVIAKVFANFTGLAETMQRHGIIRDESELKQFLYGFTQARVSFDFIDVGHVSARPKINDLSRWNMKNMNCKHIMLGISHDAGYVPLLNEILVDDAACSRVVVLEGIPSVPELHETKVSFVAYVGIFRREELSIRVSAAIKGAKYYPMPNVSSAWSSSSASSCATITGDAAPAPQMSSPLARIASNDQSRSTSMQTNAAKTAVSDDSPATATASAWKPGPRGLDPKTKVNMHVLETIKKRHKQNKLCNFYYLAICDKGDACCFDHSYKPSTEELAAMRYNARTKPCSSGQYCEINGCIYGHNCPSTSNGICRHPACKFKLEDHPPGTQFRNSRIRGD